LGGSLLKNAVGATERSGCGVTLHFATFGE
jgi:hypothetical protein